VVNYDSMFFEVNFSNGTYEEFDFRELAKVLRYSLLHATSEQRSSYLQLPADWKLFLQNQQEHWNSLLTKSKARPPQPHPATTPDATERAVSTVPRPIATQKKKFPSQEPPTLQPSPPPTTTTTTAAVAATTSVEATTCHGPRHCCNVPIKRLLLDPNILLR
jgi:hypothetical protein